MTKDGTRRAERTASVQEAAGLGRKLSDRRKKAPEVVSWGQAGKQPGGVRGESKMGEKPGVARASFSGGTKPAL